MRRLAARISKRKGVQSYSYPAFAFAGRPNVGGVSRGSEGASPTDLGEHSPGGPQARNAYNPVMRSWFCFYIPQKFIQIIYHFLHFVHTFLIFICLYQIFKGFCPNYEGQTATDGGL
jgi:hypothetical protein